METDEVCGRPLDPFGSSLTKLIFFESSIKVLTFRSSGDFRHAILHLGKRGLSGDILRARNAVGEGRHPRGRKRRGARRQGFAALRAENRHERAALGAACTLLCADGKSPEVTQRPLAKMMTMEAKYPKESNRARADSWTKLVDFFQTNMVRRCLLCQRNCAARFRAGFWHF